MDRDQPKPDRWRLVIEWPQDPEGLPSLSAVVGPVMAVLTRLAIPGMTVKPEAVHWPAPGGEPEES